MNLKDIFYQQHGKLTEELALAESPVGLGKLPKRLMPDKVTSMICGFCSTGCSLDVHFKDGRPVNLTPSLNYPVNLGEACPKGWESLTPLGAHDRVLTPYLRNDDGRLESVGWQAALNAFVDNFVRIQQQYGKESVAFLSTGQIPTEEMALLGALAKFGMGIVHGDGNTRQCMATAAVAYKESFGFDAPPYTYKDFEESDVIVLVGANPCVAHPIMWQRVMMNRHHPEIIVVDPRKTETAMAATRHYAIKPKSDLVLFYSLARILIENGWIDQGYIDNHTVGFEAFRNFVQKYTPEYASRISGLSVDQINEFAALIHRGQRVSFWWTMGVNQSYEGVRTAQALINLALMTGSIGREGTGANSITGQCNAMGSRLFSNTTSLLGGHDFTNPEHRRKIAALLGINPEAIPARQSWAYDQIIEGIAAGKIKGLWVIATNPAHSWINQNELRDYLSSLEFLVVQDMYHTTETARMADLILPAAGWGEKEGSFINSERRIGLIKKVAQAPGHALADFYIFKLIAKFWGCERLFREWESPEAVFHILKRISQGTPCDISGIRDYQMIEECGGIQWPFPEGETEAKLTQERRLFEDGKYFCADQRAKFIFEEEKTPPEPVSRKYPFVLLTGRGSTAQWHTQTRTGKSAILKKMYPSEVYVEINPDDAERLGLKHSEWVWVITRRARVRAMASITPAVRQGQIFMSMHYEETNKLTLASFDPYSRQPSYKICAADVARNSLKEDHD